MYVRSKWSTCRIGGYKDDIENSQYIKNIKLSNENHLHHLDYAEPYLKFLFLKQWKVNTLQQRAMQEIVEQENIPTLTIPKADLC